MANVVTASPIKEKRGLIDASEKPLRRSPPGEPQLEEDWPVLFPEKPTRPGTLQEMAQQERIYSLPQVTSMKDKEGHPIHTTTGSKIPTIQRKPVSGISRVPFRQSIERRPAQKINIRKLQATDGNKSSAASDTSSKNVNGTAVGKYKQSPTLVDKTRGVDMSSSAAAAEESRDQSQGFLNPRQTRTSSLRARISAGSLVTEGPSSATKVIGFTDFTTINERRITPPTTRLQPRTGSKSPSRPSPVGRQAKAPRSPVNPQGNSAPANFVVRSGRPEVQLRPNGSHTSLRATRTPSPTPRLRPPKRPAPVVPKPNDPSQAATITDGSDSNMSVSEKRKSGIPVLRRKAGGLTADSVKDAERSSKELSILNKQKEANGPTRDIADTDIGEEVNKDVDAAKVSDKPTSGHRPNTTPLKERVTVKGSTKTSPTSPTSPPSAVKVRRLSRISPEHGPILKISPSADKFIMGKESGKGNEIATKVQNGKNLHRAVVTKELRKASSVSEKATTAKPTTPGRPVSAGGEFQLSSRQLTKDLETREKRTRSADATLSPTPRMTRNAVCGPPSNSRNSDVTVPGADDPFFDAKSQFEGAAGNNNDELAVAVAENTPNTGVAEGTVVDDEAKMGGDSWISPSSKASGSVRSSDTVMVAREFLPASVQENPFELCNPSEAEQVTSGPEAPLPCMLDCTQNTRLKNVDTGKIVAKDTNTTPDQLACSPKAKSTPARRFPHSANSSGSVFPPRGSSRAAVPNYTNAIPSRTALETARVDPHLPKDFQPIQDKLGMSKGVPSTRIGSAASSSKRDSIARESNKTQGSISKGMLSNFRGLFHKRSSDTPGSSTLRPTKKSKKVAVATTGSPYPNISDVHPSHRPTRHGRNGLTTRPTTPVQGTQSPSRAPTPSPDSPMPSEAYAAAQKAVRILNSLIVESAGPRKDRCVELCQFMVAAMTQARDARMAMEQAQQAADKAEFNYMLTQQSVLNMAKAVQDCERLMEGEI